MLFALPFSLAEFQKARADIKQYYESSMSERIALYTQSRQRAIATANEIGTFRRFNCNRFLIIAYHTTYVAISVHRSPDQPISHRGR